MPFAPQHPLADAHWGALLAGFLGLLAALAALLGWAVGEPVATFFWQPWVSTSLFTVMCLSGWTVDVIFSDPKGTVLSPPNTPRRPFFEHLFVAWLLLFFLVMGPVIYLLDLDWKDDRARAHSLLAFLLSLGLACAPVIPGPHGLVSPLAVGVAGIAHWLA